MLARPLWALILLHSWQLIGQNRRNAWFALSIEAGLLLLTTSAAIFLLAFVVGFALATSRGRRVLISFDALFALLVIVVLALPYLIWLIRADALVFPHWPAMADLGGRGEHGVELLGGLLLASQASRSCRRSIPAGSIVPRTKRLSFSVPPSILRRATSSISLRLRRRSAAA